jgi:hypothetical protein
VDITASALIVTPSQLLLAKMRLLPVVALWLILTVVLASGEGDAEADKAAERARIAEAVGEAKAAKERAEEANTQAMAEAVGARAQAIADVEDSGMDPEQRPVMKATVGRMIAFIDKNNDTKLTMSEFKTHISNSMMNQIKTDNDG